MNIQKIEEVILKHQAGTQAPIAFGVRDMATGEQYLHNANMLFPMASMFKYFVLIELFRMIQRGEICLEDRVELTDDLKSNGSGMLQNFRSGCSLTLYDYCYMMMSISDNSATDVLMSIATPEKIRKDVLEPFGFEKTRVDLTCSKLLKAAYAVPAANGEMQHSGAASFRHTPHFLCTLEENNQSTAEEFMKMLTLLYENQFLDKVHTDAVMDILKMCNGNSRIPQGLPYTDQTDGSWLKSIPVAHKTGSIDRLCNDAGFVYDKKGTYAILISYNGNLASLDEYERNMDHAIGNPLLAQISKDIYEVYTA